MTKQTAILFILIITFGQCRQSHSVVNLTDKIDPEIVLINIEEGDRTFIGNLLSTIDSCKPILVAIDAWFINEKDSIQDSVLMNALRALQNEILAYTLDSIGKPLESHEKFKSLVSDEGLAIAEQKGELVSNFTPIKNIDNKIHESFSLKVIKFWKPKFKYDIEIDESIPIKFSRTLDQFIHFNGSELKTNNHCREITNKIILLGYLGPSKEDKHYTPIRLTKKYPDNEPDTYGLVMIANEIRTILEYEKRNPIHHQKF